MTLASFIQPSHAPLPLILEQICELPEKFFVLCSGADQYCGIWFVSPNDYREMLNDWTDKWIVLPKCCQSCFHDIVNFANRRGKVSAFFKHMQNTDRTLELPDLLAWDSWSRYIYYPFIVSGCHWSHWEHPDSGNTYQRRQVFPGLRWSHHSPIQVWLFFSSSSFLCKFTRDTVHTALQSRVVCYMETAIKEKNNTFIVCAELSSGNESPRWLHVSCDACSNRRQSNHCDRALVGIMSTNFTLSQTSVVIGYVQWNLGIRDTQGTVKNCPEFWGGLISQVISM